MSKAMALDEFFGRVGQALGSSSWITIDQARIDAFARATGDLQFIHVDPVRAAATPLGGTIAHGLLVLSLLPRLGAQCGLLPDGAHMALNYGFDRVRFLEPVRAGAELRAHFVLLGVDEKRPGELRAKVAVSVEIAGEDKPALVAEWINLIFLPNAQS